MTHATVLLIMDSGRSDYVRPDTMPFLYGLKRRGLSGRTVSPLGYAQRTILFTGRYPDSSGHFGSFVYDPDASPFQWVRRLGPLRALIRPRKITWPTRKFVETTTRWTSGAHHADPAWIPPKFLPYFRPTEDMRPLYESGALGAKSLFDLCREHGKRFRYLAHPAEVDDEATYDTLVRELRSGAPYDLYVAQFNITERRGHIDGPMSEIMQKQHLHELDEKFATVHAALTAGYDSWDLIICGDHGMSPVTDRVNLAKILKRAKAKPGKDYLFLINSTLAVFWYLTEKGRQAIEAILPRVPNTTLLTDEERRRQRIPTGARFGDRMLAANPGTIFWPDHFHVADNNVRGMHGYLDKRLEGLGSLVVASSRAELTRDVGDHNLVDVFPTVCDLLGLPVPPTNEGRTLLPDTFAKPEPRPITEPTPIAQVAV